jgi:hypothetical protein
MELSAKDIREQAEIHTATAPFVCYFLFVLAGMMMLYLSQEQFSIFQADGDTVKDDMVNNSPDIRWSIDHPYGAFHPGDAEATLSSCRQVGRGDAACVGYGLSHHPFRISLHGDNAGYQLDYLGI